MSFNVKDLFAPSSIINPNYKSPTALDTLSDTFLGTNNKQVINLQNQNEFNKQQIMNQLGANLFANQYINENKYKWNMNGLIKAGINPLLMTVNNGVSSQLGSNAAGSGSYGSGSAKISSDQKDQQGDLLSTILKVAIKVAISLL